MQASAESSFSLQNLLKVVFSPKPGAKVGVFIDLENPKDIVDAKFLKDSKLVTQKIGWEVFYQEVLKGCGDLKLVSNGFFSYKATGGSNLELPSTVFDLQGKELKLTDVLGACDIVLYLSTYSATAPLTAIAKKMRFRGATMHGCNPIILNSGLSKNYNEVSAKAEKFRLAVNRCDKVEIEFVIFDKTYKLILELAKRPAQKSHGICLEGEIANLPAGEIYWVPAGAEGEFPLKFKDGTIGLMKVSDCRIHDAVLLKGNQATIDAALAKFKSDPATGELGELGLGTQVLPFAGADIQDEKILGTFHVATGRSDHLGGSLTPDKFKHAGNATHEDILFAPHKTPEVKIPGVWMYKDGKKELLIKDYEPTEFVKKVAL